MKLKFILATATLINFLVVPVFANTKRSDFIKQQNYDYLSQANQSQISWLRNSPKINSLIQKAINNRKSQEYQLALDNLQQALQLAQADNYILGEWNVRAFIALTYNQMGDFKKSIAVNQENIDFLKKQNPADVQAQFTDLASLEAQSLDAIASNYTSSNNYVKAIELQKQALNLLNQRNNDAASATDIIVPTITMRLGVNQFFNGNIAESEKTLFAAWKDYEDKISYRIKIGSITFDEYELLVEVLRWLPQVLVAQNKTNQALELAELGRSRAFAELVKKRFGQENTLQQNQEKLSIEQIKQIAKVQNSTLVQYTVTYEFDPNLLLQNSDYRNIQASGLLIWVIKPTGEVTFRKVALPENKSLLDLVQSTRKSINARGRGSAGKRLELQQMHNLLIKPIADVLPTNPNARVTFIPQDLLFLIPFAALQDSNGKYLVEKHTILTAPAIHVLGLTHQQQQRLQNTIKGVLVVGNPTMPSLSTSEDSPPQQLSSLPGAEEEAKAIAQELRTQAIIGAEATKANVVPRMSQARIIHIATHGILDNVRGVFSSLALAPSGQDTGFLTAREIISLKLNSELVILSACNTGRGEITGDGVVGLSRAFIAAGVPSVIVSLWAVPDAPTATLMTEFYQKLKGNVDKAQALRQAMLTTMKQYRDPVNWAAFTLIGEGDASATLKAATGESAIAATNNTQSSPSTYYTVIPVPDRISLYKEFPSPLNKNEISAFYTSNMTSAEIVSFYRQAFSQKNLAEDTNLTMLSDSQWGQLVFNGSPNGKRIVIQIINNSDNNTRTVGIRFE